MSGFTDSGVKTLIAGGALTMFQRVKFTAGKVVAAGASDDCIGTVFAIPGPGVTVADGDSVSIRLLSAQGTHKLIAATDVSVGAPVYAAASGKVTKTAGTNGQFIALSAATGDGSIIEAMADNKS